MGKGIAHCVLQAPRRERSRTPPCIRTCNCIARICMCAGTNFSSLLLQLPMLGTQFPRCIAAIRMATSVSAGPQLHTLLLK